MKVVLVNGSPNSEGCTYTALEEVSKTLNTEGIETDIFQIGTRPLSGCIACHKCQELGRCVFSDKVNEFLDIAKDAAGFIFGSPVYYGSAAGALTCFMDRVFFADFLSGRQTFTLKPAAAVVSARRAGTTAALDQLNKYFTLSQMPLSHHNIEYGHGLPPTM
jgi:multimeric flavodoxin WrbA